MANTREQYLAGRNTGLTFYQVCQPGTDNRIAAATALGGEGGATPPDPLTAYKVKNGDTLPVDGGGSVKVTVANGAITKVVYTAPAG